MFDNSSCSVSYKDFVDGNTFHGYYLAHHLGGIIEVGLIKNCYLAVNTKFESILRETYNLVLFQKR